MAEASSRERWDHTAQLASLIANGLLRGKDQAAFTPTQFHPYEQKKLREARRKEAEMVSTKETFKRVRGLFSGSRQ